MTRWLVDGMNVVGSRPDGWWRDRRAAMAALVRRLGALAAAGDEVTVVLDGRPFALEPPDGVEVVFAPGGPNAADAVIAERVAADPEPGSLCVVTSDRALVDSVTAAGAEVVGARGFRERLD